MGISWPVIITTTIGLVLSATISYKLRSAEWIAIQSAFENASDNRISALEREIASHFAALRFVAAQPSIQSTGQIRWTPASAQPCPAELAKAEMESGEATSRVSLQQAVCRKGQLEGYLRWTVPVETIVESGLRTLRPYGVDLTILDSSNGNNPIPLYYHASRRHAKRPDRALQTPLHLSRAFAVGQRQWTVQCDGVPDVLAGAYSWAPFGFLCAGLGISLAAALLVHQRIARFAEVETLVERRTRELAAARQVADDASRLKSEFLANVSHELRTPLNGIVGMATLLAEASLPAGHMESIEIVLRSARLLQSLVDDLLDMSRIEAAKLDIHPTAVSVNELINDIVTALGPLAEPKGLELVATVSPDVPERCFADPFRLKQVLHNLLGNAIKFSRRGSIGLAVSATTTNLQFAVSDQGEGIPFEQQANIFRRFAQANGGARREHGGLGLGLSICRELVTLMNGSIQLESTPGQGSIFTVTIPRLEAPPTAVRPVPAIQTARGQDILVAEDNPINRLVVSRMLERLGYRVHAVPDGQAAVDALGVAHFAAVLMDCQMPILDGYDATRAIRTLPSPTSRTPIIALTANAMAGDRERCLASGMDDFLPKPIDLQQLDTVLRVWTAESHKIAGCDSSCSASSPSLISPLNLSPSRPTGS